MTFRLFLVLDKRGVLVMYVFLLLASASYHMHVSSVGPHCHATCQETRGCFAPLGSTTIQGKNGDTPFLVRSPAGVVTIDGHQECFDLNTLETRNATL